MTESATIKTDGEPQVVDRVAPGEWLFLAGFIAVGIFVYQQIYGPLTAQGNASGDAVNNAALFPRLVANLILGLCALQLIQLLRRRVLLTAEFQHKATTETAWRCLVGFGVLLAYLAALPIGGFYLATAGFLLAMFLLLKARPIWFAALLAVLMTLAVGYVFEELLRVVLPQGQFGISL